MRYGMFQVLEKLFCGGRRVCPVQVGHGEVWIEGDGLIVVLNRIGDAEFFR